MSGLKIRLGVRPDLVVEIREDILRERDGPMLVHGPQRLPGLPNSHPDPPRPPARPILFWPSATRSSGRRSETAPALSSAKWRAL